MKQQNHSSFFLRLIPDAFSFAIILTIFVTLIAWIVSSFSIVDIIYFWGDAFWKLLPFSMQMVLVLLLGSVIAKAPFFDWLLDKLVSRIRTSREGVIFVTIGAIVFSWINWGMGLILGGVLAIKVAQKVKQSNFALLIASAYSGFVVWHGGLSGSIPLKLASPSGFLSKLTTGEVIPLQKSIFSSQSLILSGVMLLSLPILNYLLSRRPGKIIIVRQTVQMTSFKLELSYILNLCFVLLVGIYLWAGIAQHHSLGLNRLNLLLFALALFLHPSIQSFLDSVEEAITSTAGIIIQFPLYAGIMGIMSGSGLTVLLSQFFITHASAQTFPLMTYWSAGLVNFFVPSGGGQWAVQGPVVIPAAQKLGVPIAKVAMALAWGDAWTNMLQPFWALPLLGMSGLQLKDIMGYCLVVAMWVGMISSLIIFLF